MARTTTTATAALRARLATASRGTTATALRARLATASRGTTATALRARLATASRGTTATALRARLATASRSTTATALRARLATAGRTATDAGQQAATAGRTAARRHPKVAAGLAATAAAGALAVAVAAPWAASTASPALNGTAALATHGTPAGHGPSLQLDATRHAAATPAAAHKAAAHKASHKAAGPTTIYDSVTPSAIPSGKSVATYSDGPYQASASSVAGHGKTLWIDVNGSNPRADALDVEPGDATPAGAAAWVRAKLTSDPGSTAIVYTFKSAWPATIASISALPHSMTSHVKYWIADPTGTRHILPGAAATQWYWGTSYDITAAHPGFFS